MINTVLRLLVMTLAIATSSAWATSPFPDLVDVDGNKVTTEADVGNGKWQVVMIWSTDCHVCKIMKPRMSEFHNQYKDINAEVYGIALDGSANADIVKQYMIDHKVSFPTYIGELDLIALNYEINAESPFMGTPTYLVFSPAGELRAIDFGELDLPSLERFIQRNS